MLLSWILSSLIGCISSTLLMVHQGAIATPTQKLAAPCLISVNETTVWAYYPGQAPPVTSTTDLRFQIKRKNEQWKTIKTVSANRSRFATYDTLILNLTSGTMYSARIVIMKDEQQLIDMSPEVKFTMKYTEWTTGCARGLAIFDIEEPWLSMLIWLVALSMLIICLLSLHYCLMCRCCRIRDYAQMKSPSPAKSLHDLLHVPHLTHEEESSYFDPGVIKLKEFETRVEKSVKNGNMMRQFKMLPRGLVRPCIDGNLPQNKAKNKYRNLIAYDETRVILEEGSSGSAFDYINANYIPGYCKEKAYIATQGPECGAIMDFWRMIWQEEVLVICMLTKLVENGKKMCEQYWPEVKKMMEYDHVTILTVDERVYADYTYRTFQLTSSDAQRSRKVKHLQYTGWPENGVPMYSHSIVDYLNELRSVRPGPGPVVVHCDTGTGRTGTIILCDICVRQTATEGDIDMFDTAKKMYSARPNMLDNLQQYILAHLVAMQCLLFSPTKLPCSDISLEKIKELKRDLPVHMRRLTVSAWKDEALHPVRPLISTDPRDMGKNRFPKLAPIEHNLVKLKAGGYISAIHVTGVEVEQQYLASQLPLPSTLGDFWKLVAEQKVELIIVLQRPDLNDPTCIDIVPYGKSFNPVSYLRVENKMHDESNEHFTTEKLLLRDTSEGKSSTLDITVLTCNNWNIAEDTKPPSPETLVALWSASERVLRTQGPTLVICHDGITGCGLYLALCILLERMAVEQECDVIHAVQTVRRSRPEFVKSKAQFEYLYDAAMDFARDLELYSNFTRFTIGSYEHGKRTF